MPFPIQLAAVRRFILLIVSAPFLFALVLVLYMVVRAPGARRRDLVNADDEPSPRTPHRQLTYRAPRR